tara:strand:+ start:1028 stop:1297 length:270 start_codon:yes stop_codon:yes gene_type:complete
MNIYSTNSTSEGVEGREVRCENKTDAALLLRVSRYDLKVIKCNVPRTSSEKVLDMIATTPMSLLALHTIKDDVRPRRKQIKVKDGKHAR